MSIVELSNIKFSVKKPGNIYRQILSEVNLKIDRKEIHLIHGPSGSGKTTLLQIIGLLLIPNEGSIKLFNSRVQYNKKNDEPIDLNKNSVIREIRTKIGYLFQSPYLPKNLSAEEFFYINTDLAKIGRKTAANEINNLLEMIDIEKLLKQKLALLSKGECQRVAIIAEILKNPELLLLDEPTGSLDFKSREKFWDLVQSLVKEKNLTIIIVSHDDTLQRIAQYSHILIDGKII